MSLIQNYLSIFSSSDSDDDEMLNFGLSSSTASTSLTMSSEFRKFIIQSSPYIFAHLNQMQQPEPPQKKHRCSSYISYKQEIKWAKSLEDDYFGDSPTYTPEMFRRRFTMRRPLFERMVAAVLEHDPFFVRQPGVAGREGLTALQKCTAAIRMLAYGVTAHDVDEYCQLSHTSSLNCLSRFCDAIIARFGPTYMRRATQDDVRMLYQINAAVGFPGMLGSIDCYFPLGMEELSVAWKGQQQGKSEKPTLILEAVASQDNWI